MSKRVFIALVVSVVGVVALLIGFRASNNEVVNSFEILNQKIEFSNDRSEVDIDSILNSLAEYDYLDFELASLNENAEKLDTYIQELKIELREGLGTNDFEAMDQSGKVNELLFDGNKESQKGLELIAEIANFRANFYTDFNEVYPDLVEVVDEKFSTSAVLDANDKETPWLEYNFKDIPLVAVLTKLTSIQADIKYIQGEVVKKQSVE